MKLSAIIAAYDNQKPGVELDDKFIYKTCQSIKGRPFSPRTWQQWKRDVHVRPYNRTLTLGQAMCLAAIAYDRYDKLDNCPMPGPDDIWQIINSQIPRSNMLTGELLQDYVEGRIKHWCSTKELPTVLTKMGAIAASRANVYRKIGHLIQGKRFHYKTDLDTYLQFFELEDVRHPEAC